MHQVLVALCEAHAVNVAAVAEVFSARWHLCDARPLEQFHLQQTIVTTFGGKRPLSKNTNLAEVVGSGDNRSGMRTAQTFASR